MDNLSLPHGRNAPRINRNVLRSFTEPTVGITKEFYVNIPDEEDNPYTLQNAILKKNGEHCRIWVVEDSFDATSSADDDAKVTQDQIDALADKFDAIYPLETNLLGYEYGGGTGGTGGADGDPKIQIVVFDIDGDSEDKTKTGLTLGYFNPADEFDQDDKDNPHSNEGEIFYLDSEALDAVPNSIYSTLIHEFNHMINFNVKVLGGNYASSWNETWYTEMLSMLAEDAIGPLVGIEYVPDEPNGNVIMERIHPMWLVYYDFSVMQWPSDPDYALLAYASNYAFGAYLVRNFGGPELLSHIAKSETGGKASLDAALKAINKNKKVDSIYALSRFGEALVYSGDTIPENAFSFDKDATGIIDGKTYTFPRFDIWKMEYTLESGGKEYPFTGPLLYEYTKTSSSHEESPILPYSVQLYSKEGWLNKTDNLTVYVDDADLSVTYYVMVK